MMTLVAGLSIGGLPAFVGDLLTSWGIPEPVSIPTRPKSGIFPGAEKHFVSGLAQKITIVRPYLMLAYAGTISPVKKIISELDAVLPSTFEEVLGEEDQFFAILDRTPDTVEMVALYLTDQAIRPYCMHTRGFEVDGRRLYLLGSGREAFLDYALNTPDLIPGVDEPSGLLARTIALRFGAYAMMSQWATGEGLSASWGGGFEVAFAEEAGFKKADNVLVRTWAISPDGQLASNGVNFLHHYEGPDLFLTRFSQFDDGGIEPSTTLIPSLLRPCARIPDRLEISAEWTVDILFSSPANCMGIAVQHDKPGSAGHAKFSFRNGELAGWNISKARVDALFEQLTASVEKKTPFIVRAL
jgi:hypothetical protein